MTSIIPARTKMNQTQIKYARNRLQNLLNDKVRKVSEKLFGSKGNPKHKFSTIEERRKIFQEVIEKDPRVEVPDWNKFWGDYSNREIIDLTTGVRLVSDQKVRDQITKEQTKEEQIRKTVFDPFVKVLEKEKQKIEDAIVLGDAQEALELLAKFEKLSLPKNKVQA